MTVIVVDASVVVTALADGGPNGAQARQRLRGQRLVAPELLDVEVVSALRGLVRAGYVGIERAEAAITDLADLPIDRHSHTRLLGRIWQLRHSATSYDAAYLALAEAFDAVLLTGDQRLAELPGVACRVEVLIPQ